MHDGRGLGTGAVPQELAGVVVVGRTVVFVDVAVMVVAVPSAPVDVLSFVATVVVIPSAVESVVPPGILVEEVVSAPLVVDASVLV